MNRLAAPNTNPNTNPDAPRCGRFSMAAAWLFTVSLALLPGTISAVEPNTTAAPTRVTFRTHQVGTFRSEACGVGDFNKDGKLDIVAGEYIYLAPDFKPWRIRVIEGIIDEQGKGYNNDFMNLPLDVDQDGRLDVVSCSWFGQQIEWYRNTGKRDEMWPMNLVHKNGTYECGELWDIDGDGVANEFVPAAQGTAWYEVGADANGQSGLIRHVVDKKTRLWGNGVGDINGDGRPDLLRPDVWYEAPSALQKGTAQESVWKQHPLAVGSIEPDKAEHTPQILVYDVNADGLNDLVTSSAHQYGIFWYEQQKDATGIHWEQHVIDKSWSQAHSLTLADLDNDGDLDLATGKRFMAHNGKDPGGNDPIGVYWYELQRSSSPSWVKHIISYDQGIGSGLNIPVIDLDGDGDMDIVVTGKWGGPVWFENLLR